MNEHSGNSGQLQQPGAAARLNETFGDFEQLAHPAAGVPDGWVSVPREPTAEIIAGAAMAAWPCASPADIEIARKAADIVLGTEFDLGPGMTKDLLAATIATMAPAYRAMLAAAPAAPMHQAAPVERQGARDALNQAAEAAYKVLQATGHLCGGDPFDNATEDDKAAMRRVAAAALAARQPVVGVGQMQVNVSLDGPVVSELDELVSELIGSCESIANYQWPKASERNRFLNAYAAVRERISSYGH